MTIKQVLIFDCDGVLLDSSHRYRTVPHPTKGRVIDLQHWRDGKNLAWQDKLLPHAQFYRDMLHTAGVYVIIATAREMEEGDAEYRHITEVLGAPHSLIYRKKGDNRGGAELKIKGINKLLNLRQFKGAKLKVYEDNLSYLATMCGFFQCAGEYVPSNQGH